MKRAAVLLAALLCLAAAARAATAFSVDASDLWYDPEEAGWGVNMVQQDDIVFLTLYVYGADRKPAWYVASSMQGTTSGDTVTFTGDLYATTGPVFTGTFDPNAVDIVKVGTAAFAMEGGTSGTLTYTVNGARVVKQVVRQTWRVNRVAGNYIGYLGTSCSSSTISAPEESMTFTITQNGDSFFFNTTSTSASCGYNGTYRQDGRLGSAEGTFSCTNNRTGTFVLDAIEASAGAVMARLTTTATGCSISGRFAGIRRK